LKYRYHNRATQSHRASPSRLDRQLHRAIAWALDLSSSPRSPSTGTRRGPSPMLLLTPSGSGRSRRPSAVPLPTLTNWLGPVRSSRPVDLFCFISALTTWSPNSFPCFSAAASAHGNHRRHALAHRRWLALAVTVRATPRRVRRKNEQAFNRATMAKQEGSARVASGRTNADVPSRWANRCTRKSG